MGGKSIAGAHAPLRVCERLQSVLLLAVVSVALTGCEKPIRLNEQPVSFWANPKNKYDSDSCIHATAQAIVDSGLPYPNYTSEEITNAAGVKEKRVKTVDVWVGPTRYALPGKLVVRNGMYADNHPQRFWKLRGSLPNFYPVGDIGPEIDGMGSMVDVTIRCSVDPEYLASWGKGYQSNEDGIAKVKAQYEAEIERGYKNRPLAKVSVNRRDDLAMTEVLFERGGVYNDGQPMWEASYWPLEGELKGVGGNVSEIRCTTRHDTQKRYGKMGWRCTSAIDLAPDTIVLIEIYVAQIKNMPAIYEQVKQLFINAKQN